MTAGRLAGGPLAALAVGRALRLAAALVVQRPFPGLGRYARRLGVGLPFLAALCALQLVHALGFALDELLFRGYRRVSVRAPVFVLGTPRSGTTFLHRLLAEHPRLTTFSTWECFLAPSATERHVGRWLIALDRRLGRPLGRLRERMIDTFVHWNDALARLLAATDGVTTLPVFVAGHDSTAFHAASHLGDTVRRSLLLRELVRRLDSAVDVVVGAPIPAAALATDDDDAVVSRLRAATLELGHGIDGDDRSIGRPIARLPEASPSRRCHAESRC